MRLTESVFLIGFSGSGKSTVGRLLAGQCRARFVDVDELIAKREGKTIPEIFTERGERSFRCIEARTIREMIDSNTRPIVAALGGGAFQSRSSRDLIASAGTSVYLSCSQRELARRLAGNDDRPLLDVRRAGQSRRDARLVRIRHLLAERKPAYESADIRVSSTGRTPEEVVRRIVTKLEQSYG